MAQYERRDRLYKKAKELGLPSRASFKIEEILKKTPLFKKGEIVLDLGAAPGGWTVILSQEIGPSGKVLAIDLEMLSIKAASNVRFLQGSIESELTQVWIHEQTEGKKIACVCSDMSPKLSGISFKDNYESYELGRLALKVAQEHLRTGGNFVAKIFPGEEFPEFLGELRKFFTKVKTIEPSASRKTSREVYVVALGFKPK